MDDAGRVGLGKRLDLRLEDDHAVAIEREARRLAREEVDRDEAAALLETEDDVGRAGLVVDRADGRAGRDGRGRGGGGVASRGSGGGRRGAGAGSDEGQDEGEGGEPAG